MINLSKTKYCYLWQCPKMLWLDKNKRDEREISPDAEQRKATGTEVGDLAKGLFGDYTEVTAYSDDGLDLGKMISATKNEMEKGTPVICEAAFSFDGLYCAVDILKKEGDGWAIYEVKSSTDAEKAVYIADTAYQKYVLEHCGVKLTGVNIVCIDNQYVFDGNLDIRKLFKITDVSEMVESEMLKIEENLKTAEKILGSPEEPDTGISLRCEYPYHCGFWNYCTKDLPSPSVFNIYRMRFSQKIDYYNNGIVSFRDLADRAEIKNDKQVRQIDYYLNDRGTYIDKEGIRKFLEKLSYPLYFLDFETMQPAVPKYIGTKPYAQIPFQYSLHYVESEGSGIKHREFLAESGPDPRRELAERLCRDIPRDTCVTAYNKRFECDRIKELAAVFPDLSDTLMNIRDNIVDLLEPFQSGYYYNRAMGGSFSIKSVLPAIFPDDPELDYHNLEGVHNGGEAMTVFPLIQFMNSEEKETARRNLLEYCKLDTYAMVKIWRELLRAAE